MIAFPKRPMGFSLVEIMTALAVMGILMAVALPSYRVWLQNTQIRNAAESILSGMQRARSEAVKRNTDIEFVLSTVASNETSWTVQLVGGSQVYDTRTSSEGSTDVTRTVTPVGANRITFNSVGMPWAANPSDGSAPITSVVLQSSRLTAAESRNLTVTVGFGGNIRMCDPNLSAPNPRACNL